MSATPAPTDFIEVDKVGLGGELYKAGINLCGRAECSSLAPPAALLPLFPLATQRTGK